MMFFSHAASPELELKAQGAFLGAAIGDAMGWPNEDRSHRIGRGGDTPVAAFVGWTRRAGGQYASHEQRIEPGTYSDDTQLLLATARALQFGPEWWRVWTTVELPLWLPFEAGGGGAIKRAAEAWLSGSAPWRQPDAKKRQYFAAGGNGVAMRILPHCVARAASADFGPLKRDIVLNGIATHGHAEALIGALAYGYGMHYLLRHNEILSYGQLVDVILQGRKDWGWLPPLEGPLEEWAQAGQILTTQDREREWDQVRAAQTTRLEIASRALSQGALAVDRRTLQEIGTFDKRISGAGTVAAAAAAFLASRYAQEPRLGLVEGAYASGSDTDTLGSMTAALLGAINGKEWTNGLTELLQDTAYIQFLAGQTVASADLARTHVPKPVTRASIRRLQTAIEGGGGTQIQLPDDRPATVLRVLDLPTKTRSVIQQFELRTKDGQMLRKTVVKKGPTAGTPAKDPKVTPSSAAAISIRTLIVTRHLEASVQFWSQLLDVHTVDRTPSSVSIGGGLLIVEADDHSDWRPSSRVGGAVIRVDVDDVRVVQQRLSRSLSRLPEVHRTSSGQARIISSDPDGNTVVVVQRGRGRPATGTTAAQQLPLSVDAPTGRDEAAALRLRIRQLADQLLQTFPLNASERDGLEQMAYRAAVEPGYVVAPFEPQSSDRSRPDSGYFVKIGAWEIRSNERLETLRGLADNYARLIRVARESRPARVLREQALE